MFLNRQPLLCACILLTGVLTLSACSSSDSDDDVTPDSNATTEANPTTDPNTATEPNTTTDANTTTGSSTTTDANAATGSNTTTDANATTGSNTATENSPASLRARAAINNGFYLSRRENYGSGGMLVGGVIYSLNASENLIEARNLEDESLVDSVYRYDDNGNLTSISFLSFDDFLAPIGDEIYTISIEQENGALQVIDVDYLVGAELDYQIVYTYDGEGRPLSSVLRFVDTNDIEEQQYNYENGVLVSITGTDSEVEGGTVTETISRDEQGRVSIVNISYDPIDAFSTQRTFYSYDQNGNVSEMSLQDADGRVIFREVYTYQATEEPVFNLINYDIYFQQQ